MALNVDWLGFARRTQGEDPRWGTVRHERTVLVVVRTVATLTRLLDVLALTAPDQRIQTQFTYDADRPAHLAAGVARLLDQLEAKVVPWRRARKRGYHLAMAASENDRLHELQAPVLLLPHGAGFQKYYPGTTVIAGMDPRRLMRRNRVVPAALALAHSQLLDRMAAACPPAAARSVVVGDPSLDRMLASRHREPVYRTVLGGQGRRLVVVASTWGSGSLLDGWLDLPERLVAQLPTDEYRVAVVTHPGILARHSPWQVRAWLSRAERCGAVLLPPEEGWQAALTAACCVISDHSSLSLYAAALDKPLLLTPGGPATTVPGSAIAALAARTVPIDPDGDLRAQVEAAMTGHVAGVNGEFSETVFEEPGRCAARLRPLIYGMLRLGEPPEEPEFAPVPAPSRAPAPAPPAMVVGATLAGDAVALARFPDLRHGRPHDTLDYRHVVADATAASVGQLGGATIVRLAPDLSADQGWPAAADALLAQWPNATMVAVPLDDRTCAVRTRRLTATLRAVGPVIPMDPTVFASLAYVRLQRGDRLPALDQVRIGDRLIRVVVEAGRA